MTMRMTTRAMRAAAVLVAVLLAGCGGNADPATSRLEAGQRCVLVVAGPDDPMSSSGKVSAIGNPRVGEVEMVDLPPGTGCVVVDDTRPDVEGEPGRRTVIVAVDSPGHAGEAEVVRGNLLPVR